MLLRYYDQIINCLIADMILYQEQLPDPSCRLKKREVKFSKLLVAVDGSDQSIKAAEYAIDIANRYSAQLIALTVLDISKVRYSSSALIAPPMHALKELEGMRKEAQEWLDKVGKLIEKRNDISDNSIILLLNMINYHNYCDKG